MRDILNMLDLIKAQIQARQIMKLVQTLEMRNEVIVEVEFGQAGGDVGRKFDACYLVLAHA
jgi:hypothetical protein